MKKRTIHGNKSCMQSTKTTGTYNYYIVTSCASKNLEHRWHVGRLLTGGMQIFLPPQQNKSAECWQLITLEGCSIKAAVFALLKTSWEAQREWQSDNVSVTADELNISYEAKETWTLLEFNPADEGILWYKIPRHALSSRNKSVQTGPGIMINYSYLHACLSVCWGKKNRLYFFSIFAYSVSDGSWPILTHMCVCIWPWRIDSALTRQCGSVGPYMCKSINSRALNRFVLPNCVIISIQHPFVTLHERSPDTLNRKREI